MDEEMTEVLIPRDDEKVEDEYVLFTQQVRKVIFIYVAPPTISPRSVADVIFPR